MRNTAILTEDDEGKNVVTQSPTGSAASSRWTTAHVDPDPNLTDTVRSKLGWGESDEEHYPLDASTTESVSDDEIHPSR